jgi:hypothetical protein
VKQGTNVIFSGRVPDGSGYVLSLFTPTVSGSNVDDIYPLPRDVVVIPPGYGR